MFHPALAANVRCSSTYLLATLQGVAVRVTWLPIHGVADRPKPGRALKCLAILEVQPPYLWLHTDKAVGVRKQRLDADQHL